MQEITAARVGLPKVFTLPTCYSETVLLTTVEVVNFGSKIKSMIRVVSLKNGYALLRGKNINEMEEVWETGKEHQGGLCS